MVTMMTGRVLLVCVLCVLWCGAGCFAAGTAGGAGASVDSADDSGIPLKTKPPEAAAEDTTEQNPKSLGVEEPQRTSAEGVKAEKEYDAQENADEPVAVSATDRVSQLGGNVISYPDALKSNSSPPVVAQGGGSKAIENAPPPAEENLEKKQDEGRIVPPVESSKKVEVKAPLVSHAQQQSNTLKSLQEVNTNTNNNNGGSGGVGKAPEGVKTFVTKGDGAGSSSNDKNKTNNRAPATTAESREQAGTGEQGGSEALLPKAEGKDKPESADQQEDITKDKATPGAVITPNASTESQQQTHSQSPLISGSAPTLTTPVERTGEGNSNNNHTPTGVVVPEQKPHPENVAGGETQKEPATTTGSSESSPTAPPAIGHAASTSSTRPPDDTSNIDGTNIEASNNGVTQNEINADFERTSHGKEAAAANSESSTTTPDYITNKRNNTETTADNDGSTAASHTTSPLLLIFVFAYVAAAAVVAA
ncbi:mucin-associated surface protein (MASP), putative [Trypanosoma cruzi marinkellei]|uniref:Mucin-associated surface protein (MASP), putative n=1 Tax=Trypanosoma cruzi marinkellei TaxID=85056 RepID=K2M308_TRYCR|nr:mucin-associated surface protein (MASP), putative [Trypanosoma cruzi marinkellei]